MQYRREIDGLRAVAVVPVMLFHAGFATFSGGFVGVDVFFVISGYLITTILLSEASDFSFVRFYERRARRIVPALFVVVAASVIPAWLLLPPLEMKQFAHSVAAVALFSSNLLFWRESGYFEPAAELKPLLHTWSLAVEEQFYFLFPIFLLTVLRFARRWLVLWLAGAGLLSLALAQWAAVHEPTAAFYAIPARGWELLAGALIAHHLRRMPVGGAPVSSTGDGVAQVASLAGLLLIVGPIFAYDRLTPFPGFYAAAPVLGTTLIIVHARPGNVVGRLLGWQPLVGIGLISYSAYLWHQPLFAFARYVSLDEPSAGVFLGLIGLTGIVALLTWKFVERPFRDRSRIPRRALFVMTLAGSLVMIAFGMAGRFTEGFRSARLTPEQIRLLATVRNSPQAYACHASDAHAIAPADACTYFAPDVRWAVLGDSHGATLSYALAKELEPEGIGVRQLTFSGCFPSYGRTDLHTPCATWTQRAVQALVADRHISTVVVVYKLDVVSFGGEAMPYPARPGSGEDAERDRRLASYFQTVYALRRAGKRVIVLDQVPVLRKNVSDLIYQFGRTSGDIAGVGRAQWEERSRFMRTHLGDLPTGVVEVDPASVLCSGDTCPAVVGGESHYFDDNHLSVAGARLVAREILVASPAHTTLE